MTPTEYANMARWARLLAGFDDEGWKVTPGEVRAQTRQPEWEAANRLVGVLDEVRAEYDAAGRPFRAASLVPAFARADPADVELVVMAVRRLRAARRRAESRSPIGDDEVRALEALGRQIASARETVGCSTYRLAQLAEIGVRHLRDLEAGVRRTRLSTLERLADVLVKLDRQRPPEDQVLGTAADQMARFVAAAGRALAAESEFQDRVNRRRERRRRQYERWLAAQEARASLR